MPLTRVGAVKRLIRPPEIKLESETYGAAAQLVLLVEEDRRAELERKLADLRVQISEQG